MTAQRPSSKIDRLFNLQNILYNSIAQLEGKVGNFNNNNIKGVGQIVVSQLLELEDNPMLEQIQACQVEYFKVYNPSYNQGVDTLIYFKVDVNTYSVG